MSEVVVVRVSHGILIGILGSNIGVDLNWDWSWTIGRSRGRGIAGALGPGSGNCDEGRDGEDLNREEKGFRLRKGFKD